MVERLEGTARLVVRPKGGEFISEAVGSALRGGNLAATDMLSMVGTLDDVFRSVTMDERR